MNNAFLYCLGEAAIKNNITLIISQMLSNHHHTLIYDPDGNINEFTHRFHLLTAKCLNTLRGRSENLWSCASPSTLVLLDVTAVLDRLAYTALNPVKSDLVARVHHWPGPRCVGALLNGRTLQARRPHFFFAGDSDLPTQIELKFELPAVLGDRETILADLRRRIRDQEHEHETRRARTGRSVIGRSQIRRQHWDSCPKSVEKSRRLNPRFAAGDPALRIAMLDAYKSFVSAHCEARGALKRGESVRFPAGTYWLRVHAGVETEPIPPMMLGFVSARKT